jgi:hypothetical protein
MRLTLLKNYVMKMLLNQVSVLFNHDLFPYVRVFRSETLFDIYDDWKSRTALTSLKRPSGTTLISILSFTIILISCSYILLIMHWSQFRSENIKDIENDLIDFQI